MGEIDLGAKANNRRGFDVDIKEISVHPKYVKGKAYFDVAVIETKHIEFSPVIGPICLPKTGSQNSDEYANILVELTGKPTVFK